MTVTKLHDSRRNSDPHWEARVDLACAFRWTARLDMHEGIANHFSLAVSDDGAQFLMNPSSRHFSRIRARDLLLLLRRRRLLVLVLLIVVAPGDLPEKVAENGLGQIVARAARRFGFGLGRGDRARRRRGDHRAQADRVLHPPPAAGHRPFGAAGIIAVAEIVADQVERRGVVKRVGQRLEIVEKARIRGARLLGLVDQIA